MRITTRMILRNYRTNLNDTLGGLENARRQVETGKRVNKAYQDPSAASKGAVLEQRFSRNSDYLNSAKNAQTWLDSQEDVLNQLNTISMKVHEDYAPSAITDTSGEAGRQAYASTLRELAKSMINALNTKYGDSYVMAGSDGKKAPFEMLDDGTVLYRGVDVSASETIVDADGNVQENPDFKLLQQYAKDATYIDLGFGLEFKDGAVIPSTAFNTALPGVAATGYGTNDEGISNNLMVMMNEMATLLEDPNFDKGQFEKIWMNFKEKSGELQDHFTNIGAKGQLLTA
ncbi:MAG: hypothetical protein IKW01_02530, partial [Firmicutes bacterium]|nr:hypothetical protein [Bacillota bacterium]